MSEAAEKIEKFEREVMWRMRLAVLLDLLATALLVGGLISAAFVLYFRLRPANLSTWMIPAIIFGAILLAVTARWLITRPARREAAFLIDSQLELEDRLTTAHTIIERGGPQHVVESALIEDAASRVADRHASVVAPYRLQRRHALSLVGVVVLTIAVLIPERALPGGEAMAEARADIQNAGEQLEKTAQEVEQLAPAQSQTATLAKEQAELGRAIRRSKDTRAEVLKKLSALGERIRERHDELANTRADEIVSAAEKRLQPVLANKSADNSKAKIEEPQPDEIAAAANAQPVNANNSRATGRDNDVKASAPRNQSASDNRNQSALKALAKDNKAVEKPGDLKAEQKPPEAKSDNAKSDNTKSDGVKSDNAKSENAKGDNAKTTGDNASPNTPNQKRDSQPGAGQTSGSTPNPNPDQAGNAPAPAQQEAKPQDQDSKPEGQNPLSGMMAEQAAKALPSLSEQLLKQAEALRNGQLSSADIKQLQQAAQFLARDLARIAQSKEFQQAVEQLARQIDPAQLEKVARQLMNQEQLLRELEASARLMMQNQQAKQVVAGLAETFADLEDSMKDRFEKQQSNRPQREGEGDNSEPQGQEILRAGGNTGGGTKGGANRATRGQNTKALGEARMAAQGKESKLSGKIQGGSGGEYLYLQAKPGAGAARAPYSSAYPQYRREAERSVERSKIPPHMRSVVRKYFDAINPDSSKKP